MDLTHLVRFELAHSHWALAQILAHAAALPDAKIEEDLGIGPGSLRENIAHTIEAMYFFADNFAGRTYEERPAYAAGSKSVDGLRPLLAEAGEELKASMLGACAKGLGERVPWPNADGGSMPTAAAIAQVFDHSTLHRTQCINMLKRLGVTPVPDLDPMTFQATGMDW